MSDETSEPRVYTRDEVRAMFLQKLRDYVEYWTAMCPENLSVRQRVEGAVFSTLVVLDGGTDLPGFMVSPDPHPDDLDYHRDRGENWWPEDGEDITGELHSEFLNPKEASK